MTGLTADDRQRLGTRVRTWRLEQRMDQRTLATRAGVSLGTLQFIERGFGRVTRPENVAKVAQALGITVEALATGPPDLLKELNREDVELARRFRQQVTIVKSIAKALVFMDETRAEELAELLHLALTLTDAGDLKLACEMLKAVRDRIVHQIPATRHPGRSAGKRR
jgi:transcriptional regulator with XRE-family HTH domain